MQYVKRERDLMSILDHPFFVKLYFTFQDDEKLCILTSRRRSSAPAHAASRRFPFSSHRRVVPELASHRFWSQLCEERRTAEIHP